MSSLNMTVSQNLAPNPSPALIDARFCEEQILQSAGFTINQDLHVFDVPINFEGQNYIHTYKLGEQHNETIVLLHGYAGSSVLFYPMLRELAKKYRVFCIDMLGMGLSSRPEFNCSTPEETISYFVESIEKWREAMNLESFYLAGHSFGGYMGTHYTLKYENRVQKLFMLSPVGVTKSDPEPAKLEGYAFSTLNWLKQKVTKFLDIDFWETKKTLNEYFQNHPYIGGFFLKRFVSKEFSNDKVPKMTELIFNYFFALFMVEGGSDRALYYILSPHKAQAFVPLEDLIVKNLRTSTVCYFGDKDWMDRAGAYRVEGAKEEFFKVKEIQNSSHQITMHNPIGLSQDILTELAV